jgi:hypothetical protein
MTKKQTNKKKLITEKVKGLGSIDIEGKFAAVIDTLFKLRDTAINAGYTDIFIETETGYEYGYYLYGTREETDKEYQTRLSNEAKVAERVKEQKQLKEAKDRAEYERLKKKFEGKNA